MSIYEVFIGDDGCFTLPEAAKHDLLSSPTDRLVLTPGAKFTLPAEASFIPLNCILLWTQDEYAALKNALMDTPAAVPGLQQRLLDMAQLLPLDAHGRLCLPQTLRDSVPLAGAALLRKREGKYELWNSSGFQCRIR